MLIGTIVTFINLLIFALIVSGLIYLFILLVKALRKYLKAEPIRKEKAETARSLGEVLKRHRTACKMTQEFVAEALGVSRQAVSKWESGASGPSTANLIAIVFILLAAKLTFKKDLFWIIRGKAML